MHRTALGGLRLQQIFRADDDDDRAAPVRNRIAEERTEVCGRVRKAVKRNPKREQPNRNDGQ